MQVATEFENVDVLLKNMCINKKNTAKNLETSQDQQEGVLHS